jgi:hypothetical protein
MRALVFMLWVLLWPLVTSLMDLIDYKIGETQTEKEKLALSKFQNAVWVVVAVILLVI